MEQKSAHDASTRVAVLLDGDADFVSAAGTRTYLDEPPDTRRLQFHVALLAQGEVGGRLAAEKLHEHVCRHLRLPEGSIDLTCMMFWCVCGRLALLLSTDPPRRAGTPKDLRATWNTPTRCL